MSFQLKSRSTLGYLSCLASKGGIFSGGKLIFVFAIILSCLFLTPSASSAAEIKNKCDSLRVSTLNMTEAEIAEICGIDSSKINQGPTLQQLNEENPSYIKREYNHRQQVVVGSVVMLCITLAMVLMNNYNPKR